MRRSQLISPWGVGQMVNFPGDESLMVCGLDAWEQVYRSARNGVEEFLIKEERLEKRLNVNHFRLPPDFRKPGAGVLNPGLKIPCIRFPQWHYCPKCGSMEKLSIYGEKQRCSGPNYSSGMSCHSTKQYKRPWLIPVRFIVICKTHGHIEDFPFMEWVHKNKTWDASCKLRMRAGRSSSSLSGIMISCSCGIESRSMAGAFNENSLDKIKKCSGFRPWLGEIDDRAKQCGADLKVVQRGASNVYFPAIRTSIYLPKWDETVDRKVIEVLEANWESLTRTRVNGELNKDKFEIVAEMKGVDGEKLIAAARKKLEGEEGVTTEDVEDSEELYRKSEYDAILAGVGGDNQDFFVTNKKAQEYSHVISEYFSSITLLHKLRETRSLVGFSRWMPEDDKTLEEKKNNLKLNGSINWLPAIVVRGEGVFFEFNSHKLHEWEDKPQVQARARLLINNFNKAREVRGLPEKVITPKFILLHTFAHLLINQFSFECGYGSSALRERVYCDSQDTDITMNGVLIYTASGDTEGSLGGLVRQGLPGNVENIVISALHAASWCSSDPVCMVSSGQGPDSCNLAACHGCSLLPETSCENGNRFLDRALVTGTNDSMDAGFFNLTVK